LVSWRGGCRAQLRQENAGPRESRSLWIEPAAR
jgi:hypothetical protein